MGELRLLFIRKLLRRDTIRQQLRSWVSLFVVVMGLLIFIPTIYIGHMEATREVDKQLDLVLHSKAYFFEKWLEERSKDIHTIASLDIVKEYQLEEAREYFLFVRDEKADFADLVFINKEGFVVFDTVDRSMDGVVIDVNEREYFKVAKETKKPYITDVMISLVTDKPIVIFASPILDDNNEFNGVVFGSVNVETIDEILTDYSSSFEGQSYVVMKDGTLLSELKFHGDELNGEEEYLADSHIISVLEQYNGGNIEKYRGLQGDTVLGSSLLVNNESWYLVSEVNIVDVYSSFYKKIALLFVLIVIGMLIVMRIMLYIAEKIEKPIQQLLQAVRNMESGNYQYRIDEKDLELSTKEFRELAAAFNQMGGRVSENVNLLEELSSTCQLTKLYNRRYLMEQGERIFHNCVKLEKFCSSIVVDVDYFKKVNDTYGHIVGDQVLIHLANLLTTSVRNTDIVTRYGGEEFVIISPNSSLENSVKIAERIQKKIRENPYRTGELVISITVSIGIAEYLANPNINTFTELIDKADKALYEAKENGRNQIKVTKDDVVVSVN